MARYQCPIDAGIIPQVAEIHVEDKSVRFFWCLFCEDLFAFVGESRRFAAGFARGKHAGWWVFHRGSIDREVELAEAAISRLPPLGL